MKPADERRSCLVMGIVNVTPDSFSDGGECLSPDDAIRRAFRHAADGADIVDIGGESTRPGATGVEWTEEWRRIAPVLEGLAGINCRISVDTRHPETAGRALDAGARIINCVEEAAVPAMLDVASRSSHAVELVVPYACRETCARRGFARRVYLDPMIGFGTSREQDLELLRSVPSLAANERILVGASRKRIAARLAGKADTTSGVDVAVALWCADNGASAVRVHDVGLVAQALRAWEILSRKE